MKNWRWALDFILFLAMCKYSFEEDETLITKNLEKEARPEWFGGAAFQLEDVENFQSLTGPNLKIHADGWKTEDGERRSFWLKESLPHGISEEMIAPIAGSLTIVEPEGMHTLPSSLTHKIENKEIGNEEKEEGSIRMEDERSEEESMRAEAYDRDRKLKWVLHPRNIIPYLSENALRSGRCHLSPIEYMQIQPFAPPRPHWIGPNLAPNFQPTDVGFLERSLARDLGKGLRPIGEPFIFNPIPFFPSKPFPLEDFKSQPPQFQYLQRDLGGERLCPHPSFKLKGFGFPQIYSKGIWKDWPLLSKQEGTPPHAFISNLRDDVYALTPKSKPHFFHSQVLEGEKGTPWKETETHYSTTSHGNIIIENDGGCSSPHYTMNENDREIKVLRPDSILDFYLSSTEGNLWESKTKFVESMLNIMNTSLDSSLNKQNISDINFKLTGFAKILYNFFPNMFKGYFMDVQNSMKIKKKCNHSQDDDYYIDAHYIERSSMKPMLIFDGCITNRPHHFDERIKKGFSMNYMLTPIQINLYTNQTICDTENSVTLLQTT